MAKETIQLVELERAWSGVGVYPMTDNDMLDHMEEVVVTPHRHDHYCCFFVEKGRLNFSVDFQDLELYPSSLLVSCPGQVHQTKFANDVDGWGIAVDAKLIDENARIVFEQSFAKAALLQLTDSDTAWFSSLFHLIDSSVREKQAVSFHNQLIHTMINAFFYKAAMIYQAQENERIQAYSSRSIEIVKTFHLLVKEHIIALKKPADYASEMNITVSYLNDTVKSLTGFTSTYFIQQEVVREAQRLLVYTTKSVKEIAFQLGYEDYKYFIRLFGKTIGTSPADFRRKNTA